MSSKPGERNSSARPALAEDLYRKFHEIKRAAPAILDRLETLFETARQCDRGNSRPREIICVVPGDASGGYLVKTRPAEQLIAECIAFGETEVMSEAAGSSLDLIEDLVTGHRASVVRASGRTFASALRAVRLLSEEPLAIPVDIFNLGPLTEFLRSEVIANNQDLGSVAVGDDGGPGRVILNRALRTGFDDLALALACGFGRYEVPPELQLSARHCLLARLIAADARVPKLVRGVRIKELASYLAGKASAEDLAVIREELLLECAALSSRLPEMTAHVNALQHLLRPPEPRRPRRPRTSDPRRAYAYELVCNRRLPLKDGLRMFKARAAEMGWDTVSTIQGLRDMAATYAEDFNKAAPPARYER